MSRSRFVPKISSPLQHRELFVRQKVFFEQAVEVRVHGLRAAPALGDAILWSYGSPRRARRFARRDALQDHVLPSVQFPHRIAEVRESERDGRGAVYERLRNLF